ncbi:hypothetical protein BN424_498 [Carnobacterium maltaromaticum LMA28]|uniref:Uncharacterized protein n=1 Tax=Carnobacterium maltaromaticum LMA28 TaxID=1234679 RepID=K8E274_CARML|nr:hypothetical protein BN424_498 [Carnobacterium maltaromaticum LMA28]
MELILKGTKKSIKLESKRLFFVRIVILLRELKIMKRGY